MSTGNITRRGKHSWRLKFDIGRNPATGERQTRLVTVRGTKKQAQEELAKLIASTATGQYVDASKATVAQFAERWLRDWAARNTSNKTYTRYEQLLRKHVCAKIGTIRIQKLRAADLQAVYGSMQSLSDRTRLHAHRVTHRMLRHAAQ